MSVKSKDYKKTNQTVDEVKKKEKREFISRIVFASLITISIIAGVVLYGFIEQKKEENRIEQLRQKEQEQLESININHSTYKENYDKTKEIITKSIETKKSDINNQTESSFEDIKKDIDILILKIDSDKDNLDIRNKDFHEDALVVLDNLRESLIDEKSYLEAFYCGNSSVASFQKIWDENEKIKTEFNSHKYLEDIKNSEEKLKNISKNYSDLVEIIKNNSNCFDDSFTEIEDFSKRLKDNLESESDIYEELSKIYLKKAKYTNDIQKFNSIGEDFEASFNTYFENNYILILQKIIQRSESNLESLVENLQQIKTNYSIETD